MVAKLTVISKMTSCTYLDEEHKKYNYDWPSNKSKEYTRLEVFYQSSRWSLWTSRMSLRSSARQKCGKFVPWLPWYSALLQYSALLLTLTDLSTRLSTYNIVPNIVKYSSQRTLKLLKIKFKATVHMRHSLRKGFNKQFTPLI